MRPLGRPVQEDDLHARIDGQLPRDSRDITVPIGTPSTRAACS